MGLKYQGNENKRDGMKWGTGNGCTSSWIPPILIRRRRIFDRQTLHPEAIGLVNAVLAGEPGSLDYTSPRGPRLQVRMTPRARQDANLRAGLTQGHPDSYRSAGRRNPRRARGRWAICRGPTLA